MTHKIKRVLFVFLLFSHIFFVHGGTYSQSKKQSYITIVGLNFGFLFLTHYFLKNRLKVQALTTCESLSGLKEAINQSLVVEIEIKLNALTDTEQKINALILAMQADNEELARKILTNDLLITSEELKFVHAQIKILSRQSSDNTKLLSQIQDYLQDFLEKSVDTID